MKKTPKNAQIFICEICNFKCSKQSDYDRHILTLKHKNRTIRTKKTSENAKAYIYVIVENHIQLGTAYGITKSDVPMKKKKILK